jgi:hypothetical protein
MATPQIEPPTPRATQPVLPPCPLLVPERPLLLMPRLATLIGLDRALVLQQVRYWLGDDRRPLVRDGRRWVAKSYPEWRRQHFPFFSLPSLKRHFRDLERAGLLVAASLGDDPFDHTKWYTVDFDRLLELERDWAARPARDPHRAARRGLARLAQAPDPALPPIPGSNLLLDADPLLVNGTLAALIGFNQALVLQQLYYWLGDDRRPPVRDGRRWVAKSYPEWRERDFPFWSERTIQAVFLALGERGVLLSRQYSTRGGDRTKWYTIDFARLAALADAAPENGVAVDGITSASSGDHNCAMPPENGVSVDGITSALSGDQDCALVGSELRDHDAEVIPSSLSKIPSRDYLEESKQQHAAAPHDAALVVVARDPDWVRMLVERGITAAVARRLATTTPPATIARQLAVFDRLRVETPGDTRLTAGRLRKMIEEDWTHTPAFEAHPPRIAGPAAVTPTPGGTPLRPAPEPSSVQLARQAALARIGATATDQVLWERLALDAPRLPPLFRNAIFHAPEGDAPAALIFPDEAARDRALSAAYTAERDRIARRVGAHYRRPEGRVLYLTYDEVLDLLERASSGEAATPISGR